MIKLKWNGSPFFYFFSIPCFYFLISSSCKTIKASWIVPHNLKLCNVSVWSCQLDKSKNLIRLNVGRSASQVMSEMRTKKKTTHEQSVIISILSLHLHDDSVVDSFYYLSREKTGEDKCSLCLRSAVFCPQVKDFGFHVTVPDSFFCHLFVSQFRLWAVLPQ